MFSFSPGVACFNRSVHQRYSAPQPRISPRASCGRRRCPTMGPFVAVDVRLSAIGCLHNGRPLQMRHPRAVPAIPPRFCRLGRRRAPLPDNFTFDRQTQRDGQFSAILRCPLSGYARAVCPRQALIPRHGRRHRSQFRCQTINFVSHPTELVQHVALDRIRHVFDEDLAPQRPAAGLQPSRGAGLSPIMVSLRPAPVAFAHRIRLREVDNRGQCGCRPSWRYEPITPTA